MADKQTRVLQIGAGSMGMRLVFGLVENQLGGEVELDRRGGTCFDITFTPTEPPVEI